jgi:uncharacterized membrane protein YfcA
VIAWTAYAAVGAVAGLLAGLLGVGGGVVIVPILASLFAAQHVAPALVLPLAIGTSLACIAFTSVSSLRAHHRRGAVDWQVFRRVTPGILAGTLAGSFLAAQLSGRFLKGFFVAFVYVIAVQLLLDARPRATRQLPGGPGLFGAGTVIGGVSSLVGIGGGSMTVPFLVWCNVAVPRAIGTSAAVGLPIALAGAIGYAANGLGVATLPAEAVGFVHVPALVGIAAASVLTAPVGARLAHALPVPHLKKAFALLLVAVGTRMLTGTFG